MAGAKQAPVEVEDELADLQKRFSLLQGDLKAYVEAAMWTQTHNNETVKALRAENKQLREQLTRARQSEDNYAISLSLRAEVRSADANVTKMRKQYDLVHAATEEKRQKLESLRDGLRAMQSEAATVNNQDSDEALAIRSLENRLDKAMIKYNEAMSIRKTYEQILQRLQEERLGFDNQLSAIESTLRTKEADFEEVLMMQRDALHAKDVAKTELDKFQTMIDAERAAKEREKREKMDLVTQKEDRQAQLEKKQRQLECEAQSSDSESDDADMAAAEARLAEQQKEKLSTYEDAFRQIKEATGVADVNEVIKKFLTQESTHASLEASMKAAEARLEDLRREKSTLEHEHEQLLFTAKGEVATEATTAEFTRNLAESEARMARAHAKLDELSALMIAVRTGTTHLSDMLEPFKFAGIERVADVTDETVVQALATCEQKLVRMLEDAAPLEEADAAWQRMVEAKLAAKLEASLPADNFRLVSFTRAEDDVSGELSDDVRDDNGDDEHVPTRESIKKMEARMMHGKKASKAGAGAAAATRRRE